MEASTRVIAPNKPIGRMVTKAAGKDLMDRWPNDAFTTRFVRS